MSSECKYSGCIVKSASEPNDGYIVLFILNYTDRDLHYMPNDHITFSSSAKPKTSTSGKYERIGR